LKNILAKHNRDAVEYLISIQRPFTIKPDLTFLFVIEPEIAMKRISYRKKTKFEKAQFLKNVQNVYLSLAEKEKRYRKIDAGRGINEIVNECITEIENTIVGRE
ncbi:MAG: dTMP kinase, partial [Candidatus Thermoplasmatota archaeon]|nr:dTMP kinase [Candidatus Thermoplasmatota archaeon]